MGGVCPCKLDGHSDPESVKQCEITGELHMRLDALARQIALLIARKKSPATPADPAPVPVTDSSYVSGDNSR
ncbi:hypothetical protein OpiT1DRAFT_01250 [Opitutaceae bacterium TAV1]|nr:hypothetical protein OpiT1DRAFT_01250 [Opitutaceae bacterium TAV1]